VERSISRAGQTWRRSNPDDTSLPKTARQPRRRSNPDPVPRPKTARPPAVKASEADAKKYRIPAGYSLKNWDPTEEPILLLGTTLLNYTDWTRGDNNSLETGVDVVEDSLEQNTIPTVEAEQNARRIRNSDIDVDVPFRCPNRHGRGKRKNTAYWKDRDSDEETVSHPMHGSQYCTHE
jgi:hypothetical protein